MRQKGGRFLEKGRGDEKHLWHDIGDKKAVEKTSQALREGQPKLKQKIIQGPMASEEIGQTFTKLETTEAFPDYLFANIRMHSPAPAHSPVSTVEGMGGNGVAAAAGMASSLPPSFTAETDPLPLPPLWSSASASLPVQQQRQQSDYNMPQLLNLNGGLPQSIPEGSFHLQTDGFTDAQKDYFQSLQQAGLKPSSIAAIQQHHANSSHYQFRQQDSYLLQDPPSMTASSSGQYNAPPNLNPHQSLNLENQAPALEQTESASSYDPYAQQYQLLQKQQEHHQMLQRQQQEQLQREQYQEQQRQQLEQQQKQQFQPPQYHQAPDSQYQEYEQRLMTEVRDRPAPPAPSRSFDSLSSGSLQDGDSRPAPRPPTNLVDRRRVFARMKATRQPSGRMDVASSRSLDGFSDFHMVDSQFSLMSLGGNSRSGGGGGATTASKDDLLMTLGSRRSIMSGMSRMSGVSDTPPIFADMGKKIGSNFSTRSIDRGNMSTRSIAMSEISGVGESARTADLQELIDWDLNHPSERSAI
ncbi:MAG: hypothetical protein SGILL_008783 [Bacillariaceae sp.]